MDISTSTRAMAAVEPSIASAAPAANIASRFMSVPLSVIRWAYCVRLQVSQLLAVTAKAHPNATVPAVKNALLTFTNVCIDCLTRGIRVDTYLVPT